MPEAFRTSGGIAAVLERTLFILLGHFPNMLKSISYILSRYYLVFDVLPCLAAEKICRAETSFLETGQAAKTHFGPRTQPAEITSNVLQHTAGRTATQSSSRIASWLYIKNMPLGIRGFQEV
jgi:hypothetical protein